VISTQTAWLCIGCYY